jgi:hypothetical protein
MWLSAIVRRLEMDSVIENIKNIAIATGGSTVITIGLMKLIGNKIVDNVFAKKMKEYEFKINIDFDRISKINSKEFEVLPELWINFMKVEGVLYSISKPLQEYPDLSNMNELQLKEFFDNSEFYESQKQEIKLSTDINKTCSKILFINNYTLFIKFYGELEENFFKNKIFISDEILSDMVQIRQLYSNCKIELDLFLATGSTDYKILQNVYKSINDNLNNRNNLGTKIQKRLRFL